MQRATASLLIALVALMALLPQAMCPCSLRARADATRQEAAVSAGSSAATRAPCCEKCRARLAAEQAAAPATQPCENPSSPQPCPCCDLNGQGKLLVLRGEVIKPLAPLAFEFAVLPAAALSLNLLAHATAVRFVVPDAPPVAPSDLRAGVVLLI